MAGYAGNVKLKGYLGDSKIKGYLGNAKILGGEPWDEALDLIGYSATSLEDALADSTICTALAGNAEAYGIMKTNYSSEMTAAIDSNWNEGLNLLNYACKLKCYLYKAGNTCDAVSGGWTVKWAAVLAGAVNRAKTNDSNTIYMMFQRDNGDGLYRDNCTAATVNSIDATGYLNIKWVVTKISGQGRKQMQYNSSNYSDGITSTGTHSYAIKTGIQKFYWSNVPHSDVGTQECRISNVYLEP